MEGKRAYNLVPSWEGKRRDPGSKVMRPGSVLQL